MEELFELIGPCGLRVINGYAYQYYKSAEGDILARERFQKPVFVFCYDANRILEKIKEIEGFNEVFEEKVEIEPDVIYRPYGKMQGIVLRIKDRKMDARMNLNLLLGRMRDIRGVYGVECKLAQQSEQEYLLTKKFDGRELRWYSPTELFVKREKFRPPLAKNETDVYEILDSHQYLSNNKELLEERLEILKKILIRETTDKEIVSEGFLMDPIKDFVAIESLRRTDGTSVSVVTKHRNISVSRKLLEILLNNIIGFPVKVVSTSIGREKFVNEYMKVGDIQIGHGPHICDFKFDYLSTLKPCEIKLEDAFGFPQRVLNQPKMGVVLFKTIKPGVRQDTIYFLKHLRFEGRSLEEILMHAKDMKLPKVEDYNVFRAYTNPNLIVSEGINPSFEKDIKKTLLHSYGDCIGHIQLADWILFDLGLILVSQRISIHPERLFIDKIEDIGEYVYSYFNIPKRIFPRYTPYRTEIAKRKSEIFVSHKKIDLKLGRGTKLQGRWIYPYFSFIPQIILENPNILPNYCYDPIDELIEEKGFEEHSKPFIYFSPYEFLIRSLCAHLEFGRKVWTDDGIAEKLLYELDKDPLHSIDKICSENNVNLVYLNPFRGGGEGFLSGEKDDTLNAVQMISEKYPRLLSAYNAADDYMIILDEKHMLASESGKKRTIGWRMFSDYDPPVIRKLGEELLEAYLKYEKEEVRAVAEQALEDLVKVRFPAHEYKFSRAMVGEPDEYKKGTIRTQTYKNAAQFLGRMRGRKYSAKETIFFFKTTDGYYSSLDGKKIDGIFYGEYALKVFEPIFRSLKIAGLTKSLF
jgi:hypothetical protein